MNPFLVVLHPLQSPTRRRRLWRLRSVVPDGPEVHLAVVQGPLLPSDVPILILLFVVVDGALDQRVQVEHVLVLVDFAVPGHRHHVLALLGGREEPLYLDLLQRVLSLDAGVVQRGHPLRLPGLFVHVEVWLLLLRLRAANLDSHAVPAVVGGSTSNDHMVGLTRLLALLGAQRPG